MKNDAPRRRLRCWRPGRGRNGGPARRPAGTGAAQGQATTGTGAAQGRAAVGTGARQGQAAVGRGAPQGQAAVGETVAEAMQLAIGLLTASLDSPELEALAVEALTPHDADGLGNFMAGLHVVSELLMHELHEATGEPPEAILQRLAMLAEHRRGTPSAG
jgi:hypothetical protein